MSHETKQIAIIGPTASGKSDLAIKLAQKIDAYILSIDSLSIYKEIDIIAAKPSQKELALVPHFGIDILLPNEHFSADLFAKIYLQTLHEATKNRKNLIIVGGSTFYLKSLLTGLSPLPPITQSTQETTHKELANLVLCYEKLFKLDSIWMQNIAPNDRYRIEKALLIANGAQMAPSEWFALNPPKPIIDSLPIYNIQVQREVLRERIAKRTKKMLDSGAIDEVCLLEQKYGRTPNAMSSIGIVEILEYLDDKIDKQTMQANITTHTAQLAKRQQTFNATQFQGVVEAKLEALEAIILNCM